MSPLPTFFQTIAKLHGGVESGVFPSAEFLIAQNGSILLHKTVGTIPQPKHFFDLASLTKPLATALISMRLFENGKLSPEDPVSKHIRTKTLQNTTLRELYNHTSGLIDWFAFYQEIERDHWKSYSDNKHNILERIINEPQFKTQSHTVRYSDLGYMVLGHILETITQTSLSNLFETLIAKPLHLANDIFFHSDNIAKQHAIKCFLPTETCPERHTLTQGYVMDQNCFVMGGCCGHAGLFSHAAAIHSLLLELRKASKAQSQLFSRDSFRVFCQPSASRNRLEPHFTLGFDTPSGPTSQSGSRFSANSIGHLGYSGTSFWWDLDQDVWMILLTNRCFFGRSNNKIKIFRPELHDQASIDLSTKDI